MTLGTKTRLSICKDGGVVTFETPLDQLLRAGGVDGVLLRVHVEQIVVGEGFVFPQDNLRLPGHHVRTDVTSFYLLPGQLRTNPAENNISSIYVISFSVCAHQASRKIPFKSKERHIKYIFYILKAPVDV